MSLFNFALIDPHIHQWDPRSTPHPARPLHDLFGRQPALIQALATAVTPRDMLNTVGRTDYLAEPYLPGDYAHDCGRHEVEAVVHVQASWEGKGLLGPVGETRWLEGLPFGEGGRPRLGGIVAYADPAAPQFGQQLYHHGIASPRLRGIRAMASHHADPGVHNWHPRPGRYRDPAFLKGFAQLHRFGLRFDAWVYSHQLPDVTFLAERFPQTPIVIDHLGTPVGLFGPVGRYTGRSEAERAGIFRLWQDNLARLAEQPQVHAKLSGLFMPVLGLGFHRRREQASVDQLMNLLGPVVEHALKVFGPERLIWASNFPMDKITASLEDLIEAHARLVAVQGRKALRAVFRDNARQFYDL